jgi:P-type Cu+ transporter
VEGTVDGKQILIGNRRLLEESGIGGLDALDDDLARLEARGRTAVLVARDGHAVGIVAVADAVKPDSKRAIDAMHALGLKVAMVTGDNERAARAVAEEVGIDEVLAGVLPEGKVDEIRKLQARFGPAWPWWATASTTPRRSNRPTWASPSAPARTWPSRPPTSPWCPAS